MGKRIVKQPNGLLAYFSEIVDDFTIYDMTEAEAMEELTKEMGRLDARAKLRRGLRDEVGWPGPTRNGSGLERFRDAIDTIRRVHGDETAEHRILELSRAEP